MSNRLTDHEKAGLRELRGTANNAVIAREMMLPRETVRDFYRRDGQSTPQPATPAKSTILRSAVLPLNIEIPKPTLSKLGSTGTTTALLYSDPHFPHQDEATLAILRSVAFILQPDFIGNLGDMLDCTKLSRFDKDPNALLGLQDEIDMARVHLAQMRQLCPDSRFVLFEGNHEDRLRRVLWSLKDEAAVLRALRNISTELTWPKLLGLDELHIEFVPYGKQSDYDFLPKFLLKHGDKVRGYSSMTARAEMEQYNSSGASGHTHRLGQYYRRDRNGAHVWLETGCCCSLDPQYVADPNWQNGFAVLTFDNATGAVGTESINVVNGTAMWRGKILSA